MLMKEEQHGGEAVQHNNEYIKNPHLEGTEMYLDKKSKEEIKIDGKVESSPVTKKITFFRELKEQSDNFAQSRDIPGESKILLDASDEDKPVINVEKEQILSEKPKEMGSEIKEVSREPDNKNNYIDCKEHASTDQTNKKAQEKGASPSDWNVAQFPFSSHSSQDTGFSDPTHSEEKPSQLEQLQPFLSLSHYKLLLGSQSFTDKNKNYLQEAHEDKNSKNENSQTKSSVEILMRNQEIEEKNQFYQKMKGETNMKVDFSNQGIFLPSSAVQDNGDSENVIEEAQLLTDTSSTSSEKYLLDHTMDSLFKKQKLKEKDTEDKECTNIQGNNQFFSGEQHDAPEIKFNVQRSSQQYNIMKRDFTSSNPNCNYNKWLVSLQKDDVTDSYQNRELAEMKNIESMSSDAIEDDFPLCLNYYKSLITRERMVYFSQERAKGKIYISEHLTENNKDKQYGKENTENESNKPINEEDSNILHQQGLSTEATSQGVFQSEKEIDGHASNTVSYNSVNVKKKNVQDPQRQTDKKIIEEKHGSMTDKYVANGQYSDSSLRTRVVYDRGTQEQMTSSSSGTFPKENMHSLQGTIGLTYEKEDGNEPKNDHTVTSYYLGPQDGESSNIIGLEPDEKCINQVICDKKIHSAPDKAVEKLKILGQHKQIDGTKNNEGTKFEHQKEILDIMPKLPGVKSQGKNEDILLTIGNGSLLQKHSVAESISSENPPLNIEMQSETYETDNNVNPTKLFSHDIPHPLEAADYKKDYIPPHTKDNGNIYHLATDPDDEILAHKIITLLPKNLKCVEKQGYSEYVRDSQGKDQKVIENDKETEHSGRSEKPGRQGVVSNIFGKTSWLFGDLFQNKPKDVTKNKDDGNIIVTQTKTDRKEADVVESDFEQSKSNIQSTKPIHSSDIFNIIEQESKGKIYSYNKEKSITKDLKNDNQRETVSQETVQNGKWIRDTELDLTDASFFMRFQETYIKLIVESKRILQANVCERHELESLAQEFEKVYHEITTFPCENIDGNQRQLTTSQEDEHKLNFIHEKCLKAKHNLLRELQSLVVDIENNCGEKRAKSGIMNKEQLPGNAPKESNYLNSDKEPNNSQHSETNNIPPVNNEEKMHTSIKNDGFHPDFKGKLPKNLRMTQNTFINNEREWLFQIILLLNDFCAIITSGLSIMTTASKKVLGALPENMRPGPDLYGFPWEIAICGAVLAIFVILLLMCRSYQSVTSRLYVGREKQLASKVAELIEDKCKILEKLSLRKKEYEELENSLKDASLLQGSTTTSDLKKAYEELSSTNSVLKNEIALLEKELREEKSKGSELDDLMVEIQRRVEYSENEAKSIQSQIAEAKTTLKVYEINRERLKISLQDALEENSHLQESEKQLLQEAEGWHERLSELNEQTKMFQCSKADMEEALKNKESQVKSLTECLLEMKDWSSAIGEHDAVEDSHWENDIKCERENGEHLDDQEKRTIKKLIYAAKLNACLKSMETERNQIYSKLTDEKKAKEELAERIECLQKEHGVLQSENTHFENEVQKLQQKVKVMSELYQENEMNLHRKLTVEEKERLQKEEKLSKVDEKIIHAAEELNIYRQQAKDLEEELERTVRSYQNQIMSHEKKAHDNWLTARAAERHLNDLRKENLHNRQKLTEAEFKCDLLEKDPYALDVPVRPFGRGSRGPGNPGTYDIGNERGEMNSDRLSDPHRPPSDTGSLSPPWDRDHRINPSHTGQLYNEQSLTPRRPERFYSNHPNSGRLSGPAELRSYNMQSFDKADGRQAAENNSRMDMSGNGIKDHLNDSNAVNFTDQSLAPENETLGPGIVPPPLPLLRPPLIPMDPRGAFIRRGPPFPPMPPSAAYGPREYFPRDFAGLPRPLLPMRGPFPVRPFSQYPPPRAGFFPPMPPDNRNELPAESTHLSAASSTDHQDSQQET
ncbi:melanoma inhibitory activity protein 2 isoform X2 [Sceloporus undulatus]|uniref:melanoma inhibitory activity protein 2 isoform X2 n=1 Tax=Sceloporus undulatus TaxID=8520 RepID=UPI001C4D5F77|nr:melanoma inhibitory activity protein 2 isoform X2 [Sceloporus undulatus]